MNINAYSKTIITNSSTSIEELVTKIIELSKAGVKVYIFSQNIDEIKNLLSEKISTENLELAIEEASLIVLTKLGEKHDFVEMEITDGEIKNEEIKSEIKFNWDQYDIEHASTSANIMVRAGAGTGKTRTMLQRIMFLVEKEEIDLTDIALVTFTNEAANEMKEKLKKLLLSRFFYTKQEKYLKMLEVYSKMCIKTIDSFSRDIVKELGYQKGLGNDFKLTSIKFKKEQIVKEVIDEKFSERVLEVLKVSDARYYEFVTFVLDVWQKLTSKGIDVSRIREQNIESEIDKLIVDIIEKANDKVLMEKSENDFLEINDLKFEAEQLLNDETNFDGFKHSYKYVFIDEFQDTDDMQINFFTNFVLKTNSILFIVGDEKQAIYRFRGSEDRAFETIKKTIEKFEKYSMNINYRTNKQLLDSMTSIFTNINELKENMLESELNVDVKNKVEMIDFQNDEFDEILLEKIGELINSINLENKEEIAILCRKNYQVEKISNILSHSDDFKGMFRSSKEGALFSSQAAQDLYYFMSLLLFPESNQIRYCITTTPYFYHKNNVIEKIQSWESTKEFLTGDEQKELDEMQNELKLKPFLSILRAAILNETFEKGLVERFVIQEITEEDELKRFQEEYWLDLNTILELIANLFGTNESTLTGMFRWLEIKMQTDKVTNRETNSKVKAPILITTIHQSKGLEYDKVIIPYMDDPIFTRPRDIIQHKDKHGFTTNFSLKKNKSEKYKSRKQSEYLELYKEETRLLYVGMTRAKSELILFIPVELKKKNNFVGILRGDK